MFPRRLRVHLSVLSLPLVTSLSAAIAPVVNASPLSYVTPHSSRLKPISNDKRQEIQRTRPHRVLSMHFFLSVDFFRHYCDEDGLTSLKKRPRTRRVTTLSAFTQCLKIIKIKPTISHIHIPYFISEAMSEIPYKTAHSTPQYHVKRVKRD